MKNVPDLSMGSPSSFYIDCSLEFLFKTCQICQWGLQASFLLIINENSYSKLPGLSKGFPGKFSIDPVWEFLLKTWQTCSWVASRDSSDFQSEFSLKTCLDLGLSLTLTSPHWVDPGSGETRAKQKDCESRKKHSLKNHLWLGPSQATSGLLFI